MQVRYQRAEVCTVHLILDVALARRLPMEGPCAAGIRVVAAKRYRDAVSCWDSELQRQYWSCRIMIPCAVCPSPRSAIVSWLAMLCAAAQHSTCHHSLRSAVQVTQRLSSMIDRTKLTGKS